MERIEFALQRADAQGMKVRAIYLTAEDRKELRKWTVADTFRLHSRGRTWEGLPLRYGKRSRLYSTQGVAVAIPVVRKSRRTK